MVNRLVEVVGKFVMVEEVELFMGHPLGRKFNFLSGPGKAPNSKRYRAPYSKEDAVKKSLKPSHSDGTNMPGTTVGRILGSSDNSC
jgi:hypothetical protein